MAEFGLIGEKLSHSYSKQIHGLLAGYGYELISLNRAELDTFLRERNFKGVNVTIPYKREVLSYCDELSDDVKRIGSANTLVNQNGRLHAYNTDYQGFLYMANRAGIGFRGKKVLILGTGGTSLTAQAVAAAEAAQEIVIASRTGEVNYGNLSAHCDSEIIVNTTPVGMFPNNGESLVRAADFPGLTGAIDVVYNPLHTPLLLEAKQLGIPCANGLAMLVAQAKYAAEHFLSRDIPDERIEQVLAVMLKDTCNLVLVGMPGSGKTRIGALCARMLGRELVDTDDMIEQEIGITIPEMFRLRGEAAFRDAEQAAIARCAKQTGLVIATGGGAVLRKANRDALRQNGIVVFLERGLDELATGGRPLSVDTETLERLYRERLPLYQKLAHGVVPNDGSPEDAAKQAVEVFYEHTGH